MSDIKEVKYDIPAPAVKKTRKGRARPISKTPKVVKKPAKPTLPIGKPIITAATVPSVTNSNTSPQLNNAKTLQTAINGISNRTPNNKKN